MWKGLDIAEIHIERPVGDLHLVKYGFIVELAVCSDCQIEMYGLLDSGLLRAERYLIFVDAIRDKKMVPLKNRCMLRGAEI